MYHPKKRKNAKSQHNSLSRQHSIEFVTEFTQTMYKFTQALLASMYVVPSLVQTLPDATPPIGKVPPPIQQKYLNF